MKSDKPERKRSFKLKIEDDNNFKLFGISSHENDYRLVWAINNQLSYKFNRIQNVIIRDPKLKTDLEFSQYLYTDEDQYLSYYLISNRCPDGFLFPEIKNLDFLLQISGGINDAHLTALIKSLKKISILSAIFIINPKKLRDADRILVH